jgi:hypothetical protein
MTFVFSAREARQRREEEEEGEKIHALFACDGNAKQKLKNSQNFFLQKTITLSLVFVLKASNF